MIIYIKNYKELTKQFLALISKVNKVAEYMVHLEKSIVSIH